MAIDDSPVEPDERSPETPALHPAKPRWTEQCAQLLVALLPEWLKKIVEKGLLHIFLVVLAVVVVLPPLVVLLAATWLYLLGNVDIGIVKAIRSAYLDVIQGGFSIEEVASRSNIRLDYLQLFGFDLRPKVEHDKELRLSLEPNQKAAIDIWLITYTSDEPACSVPERDIELISVFLGDQLIRTLKQGSNFTIVLGKNWWQDHVGKFGDDDLVQRLSFKLTTPAKALTCGRIRIEGSVRVFKDLLLTSTKK